jgi:hypothetical protein
MFENATITATCPKCKKEIKVKLGDAYQGKTIRCSCGQEIILDGKEAKAKMAEVENLLRQLGGKTFGR